jgi:phosphatidylinositol glycan class W
MDIGVGAIVFASGLVSKPAQQEQLSWLPLARRLAQGLRSAAPALALGLVRLAATRAVGYQEHVGEYGAHWNFFLTAGLVALLAQAVALPSRWLGPAGLALAMGHQAALSLGELLLHWPCGLCSHLRPSHLAAAAGPSAWPLQAAGLLTPAASPATTLAAGGLSSWVHSEARGPGLVAANKEGLGSLPGYWALYMLGAAAGQYIRSSGQATLAKVGEQAGLTFGDVHQGALPAAARRTLVQLWCPVAGHPPRPPGCR